ncbi:hypothetical protein [Mesorhizobium loti]|uniref:hypothetical protein n=1 Tax=Rhizobium loti TaxID=381 RepID=UPI00041CC97A|nr:hypothetical protein [Mesorhizobium loti]
MTITKIKPDGSKPQRRIVLDLMIRPQLREVVARLRRKTGMLHDVDIIMIALKQFDTAFPEATAQGTTATPVR